MASSSIKGLTIEIGANTQKFTTAMKDLQSEAKDISKDLKTVNENLKLDPKNVATAADKLKLLQQQANNAAKKVDTIVAAIEKFKSSRADKTSNDYKKSLEKLEKQLDSAKREQSLANAQVEAFGKAADSAGGGASRLGDIIQGNLISAAIQIGIEKIVDALKQVVKWAVEAAKNVAKFIGESIDLAKNMEETRSKVAAVFGEEGQKQIEEWAANAAHDFHTTKQAAMEAASSFGNILVNMDMTTESAKKYSEELVLVAAAQADFNNMKTEDVLEKIQSALAGNYKGLQSLGIVMKEADIIERALNETHKENADELTDVEKKQAALNIIMEKSAFAVQKYSENSGSLVSMQGELAAKFQDVKTEIGERLYPVAEEFFRKIIDFTNTEQFSDLLDTIYDSVSNIAESVLEFINSGQMEQWIQWLTDNLPTLGEKISDVAGKIIDIIDGIWDFIDAIKNWKSSVTDAMEDSGLFKNLPQAPSYASGGSVTAGNIYRINDDAGRRTEMFIPSTNGYILNGNQTDRVINNNNSRNFSGGINVYVNSYGMNISEVADELGQAIQNKLRMSGAML